jgi:4-hydroxy-2-oxoheptanedioate aldolase
MSGADSLRENRPIHGFWCVTGHPAVVDTAAAASPDFVCIDTQHGVDLGQLDAALFTVLAEYRVPGLVRVESIDVGRIGRALDLGASGVIVPLVDTVSDTELAVAATRHAPRGARSYGMQTRRLGPFDERPFVVIQVETAAAVENIDDIARVDGVDALYIGPADLGLALGGKPAPDVSEVFDGAHTHADVLASAFRAVIGAAEANGVIPGLHCGDGISAARAIAEGFGMTSVATDLGLVGTGLGDQLDRARESGH